MIFLYSVSFSELHGWQWKQATCFDNRLHTGVGVTSFQVQFYRSFHIYFRVVAYCSYFLQPDADLSYEVPKCQVKLVRAGQVPLIREAEGGENELERGGGEGVESAVVQEAEDLE